MRLRLVDDQRKVHKHDILLEMAPLDTVPHAIHLFLEQVDHKLWHNCQFYLNGPHVLQGGPQSFYHDDDDEVPAEDHRAEYRPALKPFSDKGLDKLAFPDYSADFPHVAWTVGFTGRPGGPDIYINKVDNTIAHGPGGQSQYTLNEFGDPCFARVIDGQDVFAKIFKMDTYEDNTEWHYFLQDPIIIRRARVLNKPPPPVDDEEDDEDDEEEGSDAGPKGSDPAEIIKQKLEKKKAEGGSKKKDDGKKKKKKDEKKKDQKPHRPVLPKIENQVDP